MDEFTVRLEGIDPIIARLRKLTPRAANRAMRRALRKGGNVIRDAVRSNAQRIDDPESAANIAKNAAVVAGSSRRERAEGGPMVRVGIRGGARPLKKGTETGLPGGNTTHWRLVEFGTSEARAQPFMRPAMQSGATAAFAAVAAAAPGELDKELAKLGIV